VQDPWCCSSVVYHASYLHCLVDYLPPQCFALFKWFSKFFILCLSDSGTFPSFESTHNTDTFSWITLCFSHMPFEPGLMRLCSALVSWIKVQSRHGGGLKLIRCCYTLEPAKEVVTETKWATCVRSSWYRGVRPSNQWCCRHSGDSVMLAWKM